MPADERLQWNLKAIDQADLATVFFLVFLKLVLLLLFFGFIVVNSTTIKKAKNHKNSCHESYICDLQPHI